MPSSDRVAVLLVEDQRRGRAPDHCVKTGIPTADAVQVTAVDLPGAPWWQLLAGATLTRLVALVLRRPRFAVTIDVSQRTWDIWRFRVGTAIVVATAAVGIGLGGLLGDHPGFGVFGGIVVVLAWLGRVLAAWRCWFGVRFRHDRGQVLVHRASAAFDADARRLFVAAQSRRR
ncbi:MAG: hypothetical protein QM733_00855 [Ilumatobacteraceae bacterium]